MWWDLHSTLICKRQSSPQKTCLPSQKKRAVDLSNGKKDASSGPCRCCVPTSMPYKVHLLHTIAHTSRLKQRSCSILVCSLHHSNRCLVARHIDLREGERDRERGVYINYTNGVTSLPHYVHYLCWPVGYSGMGVWGATPEPKQYFLALCTSNTIIRGTQKHLC